MPARPAILVILSFALAFAAPLAPDSNSALTPSPTIPRLVPPKDGPSREPQFYVFSWQEFFALNWPVKITSGTPERGVADPGKQLGDLSVPRVWETWKADYELFPSHQSGALTPTPWSSWEVAGGAPCDAGAGVRTLPFVAKGESVVPGGVNQAMGGPLVDQNKYYVRYEIRVNQSEYEKIVKNNWFLRKNLSNYPKPPNLLDASTQDTYGAIELKAAWRRVNDSEKSRYYTTQAVLVDPKTGKCGTTPVTMGLVGLHIAHKTGGFKAWVWSTFEQVDNAPEQVGTNCPHGRCSFYDGTTSTDNLKQWGFSPTFAFRPKDPKSLQEDGQATPVQVLRLNPIKDMIKALNDQVHQLPGVKGTVWENYELVAGQWQDEEGKPDPIPISNDTTPEDRYPELKGFPTPDAIANTSMESFYQGFKGNPANPARNRIGIPSFGSSCLHCHYAAAQYDFSWMLADQAWPSSPGSEGTTKADLKAKKGKQ